MSEVQPGKIGTLQKLPDFEDLFAEFVRAIDSCWFDKSRGPTQSERQAMADCVLYPLLSFWAGFTDTEHAKVTDRVAAIWRREVRK